MLGVDVRNQAGQHVFGPLGGEVGDLRLEGADGVGGGGDDVAAEAVDGLRPRTQMGGDAGRIRVQPHAQHRVGGLPALAQRVGEARGRVHGFGGSQARVFSKSFR